MLIAIPSYPEAAPIIKKLRLKRQTPNTWSSATLTLAVIGTGPEAAERIPTHHHDTILVAGLAGALDPGLTLYDTIRPATVIDPANTDRIDLHAGDSGITLLTTSQIARTTADKHQLHHTTHAQAVDMETHAIARRHHTTHRIAALRVISDTAHDDLPPGIEHWLSPTGRTRPHAILHTLLTRPAHLAATTRFMAAAASATRALADAVADHLPSMP
ncbi:phosphorylase family protein [Mucisphaera calidilacus]|uniref:phosphorylase family protein n=1 Tax=Mucisphaera calidilacus TaxID=2527982 RepID=UPI0011A65AA1|nr:hypothetical protein [Mucisphaera calidilacus]